MRAVLLRTCTPSLHRLGLVPAPAGLGPALVAALEAAGEGGHEVSTQVLTADVLPDSWSTGVGRMAAELLREHPDAELVHAVDVLAAAAALAARRRSGARVVVRAQPVAADSASGAVLWPLVLRAADSVLAPTAEDAAAAVALGADPDRVVQCLDGALVAEQVCAGAPPMEAELDSDDYVLTLSGVPDDPATVGELLRSARRSGLRLVVASPSDRDADRRQALLEAVERAGDAGRVECVGRLDHDEVVAAVDRSSVVVSTRRDPSSALSALVAMHRARPVVAVDASAARAAVVDGLTGVVVDPGATGQLARAVGELGDSRFRRLAWGVAGRDRVESCFGTSRLGALVGRAWELAAG